MLWEFNEACAVHSLSLLGLTSYHASSFTFLALKTAVASCPVHFPAPMQHAGQKTQEGTYFLQTDRSHWAQTC